MNGPSNGEGRLEISYNGVWGTVCSDFFEDVDASVACNMLGYGRSGRVIYNQYGSGYGPIWLDDVSCYGYEWSLVDCGHTGWGVSNCNHYQDVAISCNSDQYPTTASAETVRLANSAMAGEGRLEVYYNGVWGTVCSDRFDNQSASVACYMLGFGRFGRMIYNQYGPGDGPIWLDEVQCSGSELSLSACAHNPWGVHDCSHSQDASIACIPLAGSVRLANSSVPTEGRLEVYYNGAWGTVCDDSFDNQDASVACNMLGFGHVGRVIYNQYGSGTGQIWLAEVRCSGSESSLSCCFHNGWGVHDCNHTEDVSISCTATTPSSPPIVNVRLADSMVQGEGRLEISYNGVWGTVCDDFFEDVDASVACSMLGLGCSGRMINNQYGPGYGQIWLDDVDCVGSESSLADCRHIGWGVHNCGHYEDVSISCNPASSTQSLPTTSPTWPPTVSVRLVNSPVYGEGRLEVYYNGVWGTVCDDGFNDQDAAVACNMLGFGRLGQMIYNQYGPGYDPIWLDDVNCLGSESSLADCRHNGWGVHNCAHAQDVSISCINRMTTDRPGFT
jgi:deleted-in-malignant-brain-tumors protein 1